MAERRERVGRVGFLAAGLAAATDVAYLAIIRAQGTAWISARVAFVACFIASGAVLALVGATGVDPGRRTLALGAATGVLVSAGLVGIFSIGLPLLLAAVPAGWAWRAVARGGGVARRTVLASLGLAAACPALLVGGL
ncbi:MAG TPA: hypothetical protein VNO79_13500, partial [Actinomycetota bacterium]|nr:hypothetical protein [Actinomycetota bacterium]